VVWTDSSNSCGIAFVDLPAHVSRQIDEWIFSNLIDIAQRQSDNGLLNFGPSAHLISGEECVSDHDGLILSSTGREAIRLETSNATAQASPDSGKLAESSSAAPLTWLSRPLSPRSVAWAVDSLLVMVALLLFILIFLSIAHELPSWPLTMGSVLTVAIFILLVYRGLFEMFGGGTLGDRLTRMVIPRKEKADEAMRFR
jgi:hypothetical protein